MYDHAVRAPTACVMYDHTVRAPNACVTLTAGKLACSSLEKFKSFLRAVVVFFNACLVSLRTVIHSLLIRSLLPFACANTPILQSCSATDQLTFMKAVVPQIDALSYIYRLVCAQAGKASASIWRSLQTIGFLAVPSQLLNLVFFFFFRTIPLS